MSPRAVPDTPSAGRHRTKAGPCSAHSLARGVRVVVQNWVTVMSAVVPFRGPPAWPDSIEQPFITPPCHLGRASWCISGPESGGCPPAPSVWIARSLLWDLVRHPTPCVRTFPEGCAAGPCSRWRGIRRRARVIVGPASSSARPLTRSRVGAGGRSRVLVLRARWHRQYRRCWGMRPDERAVFPGGPFGVCRVGDELPFRGAAPSCVCPMLRPSGPAAGARSAMLSAWCSPIFRRCAGGLFLSAWRPGPVGRGWAATGRCCGLSMNAPWRTKAPRRRRWRSFGRLLCSESSACCSATVIPAGRDAGSPARLALADCRCGCRGRCWPRFPARALDSGSGPDHRRSSINPLALPRTAPRGFFG